MAFEQLSVNIFKIIDLLWLPVGWFAVHRHQRWITAGFVVLCILTLRLQSELMESTGFSFGFIGLMTESAYVRGLIVYGLGIALFLILAHLSPLSQKIVVFGAALGVYFAAFCVSMIVMTF